MPAAHHLPKINIDEKPILMAPRNANETTTLLRPSTDDYSSQLSLDEKSHGYHPFWHGKFLSLVQALNLAIFACSVLLLGFARYQATSHQSSLAAAPGSPPLQHPRRKHPTTNSKYKRVQGMGFQIYTGGAPAFFNVTTQDGDTVTKHNPECKGLNSYGSMWTETGDELQCYIGNDDAEQDVQSRLAIMRDAVEQAYHLSGGQIMADMGPSPEILKIFIAPEFFWRGHDGAYVFDDEAPGDTSICGPVCQILKELEEIVADKRFEDWLFLFGSIIAVEPITKSHSAYDSLFYNFAPVYKGYDPQKTDYKGKRFIAPKRYLSTSDFMTPTRHLDTSNFKELIDLTATQETHQQTTVMNPIYSRGKYDFDMWVEYKEELDSLGYALLEHGWLMLDGLALSLEICLDHQVKTALNSYTADMTTGRQTLIPSSSDRGLEYVHIPEYQAQIGVVSSAGMTIVQESLALTQHGTLFLQDGLSNATNNEYWSSTGCEFGWQFEGGTEAIQRRAYLSSTDVYFEHTALKDFHRYNVYGDDWGKYVNGSFTNKKYPPQITIFDTIDIAKVTPM
jgi:hypothetical protein